MRPVDKGAVPLDDAGNPKQYSQYQNARRDLINRLGNYCSYCEMKLDASLAVEHVQPKKHHEHLALSWSNFLLGCTNCNSIKSDKNAALSDCLWPDKDNTFRAFKYDESGTVKPADNLAANLQSKVEATIALTGLDRTPFSPTASDNRWIQRQTVWEIAQRAKRNLAKSDNEYVREIVVDSARGNAYWSIWITVFSDDSDMLNRLIQAIPGTAQNCFDTNGRPVPRPDGQL